MSDSGSDDDDRGYQPVMAEKLRAGSNSPSSPRAWPKDGVNVYTNELFHGADGDVLSGERDGGQGGGGEDGFASPSGVQRPNSSNRMAQQKNSLADRRRERLANNIYEAGGPGPTSIGRSPLGSPGPQPTGFTPRNGGNASSFAESPVGRTRADSTNRSFDSSQSVSAPVFAGLASTYDPHEEEEEEPPPRAPPAATSGNGSSVPANRSPLGQPQRPPQPIQVDLSDIPSFLMEPGPRNGPIQCYISRDKASSKAFGSKAVQYNLYLEDGQRFLLAARKRKKATTSNYVLSVDYENLERNSDKFFGKLRSNFVGTEFTIYDAGDKNGGARDRDAEGAGSVRQELGCVTYQYNVLGTRGPRKMTGVIPALDEQDQSCYRPTSEEDTLTDRLKSNRQLHDLVIMHNKPPRWNDELNAYCLNFNGRVTEASVKNFQLITDDNQHHVILQFGKTGKNRFTMDYQFPINALQAFAICLSSFDNKLACE